MKCLSSRPTINELTKVYNSIQENKVSLELFLSSYQWCRYDPRLGEMLVEVLKTYWSDWNPMKISKVIREHRWPQVLGVIGEHASLLLPSSERRYFLNWLGCCFYKVNWKSDGSLFHIGLYKFGGKLLKCEALEAIPLYSKWGFYAKNPMINIGPNQKLNRRTLIKRTERFAKLNELFQLKKSIQVSDYMKFLDFKISRRTAELDLSHWARKKGQTKGARYISSNTN